CGGLADRILEYVRYDFMLETLLLLTSLYHERKKSLRKDMKNRKKTRMKRKMAAFISHLFIGH
ncbi:hypothetical protein MKC72_22765, partial [[Clostridium] innocuum]|nr:hypothetical protein [[Clostridium] innocuum]